MNTRSSLLCLLALECLIGLPLISPAANLVVTNLADSGAGSLRAAVTTANANTDADVITFDAAMSGQIIALNSGIVLSNQVTIDASGLADGITVMLSPIPQQVANSRVFQVATNAVVELNDITVQAGSAFGNAPTVANTGGGILVGAGGAALTLNHCTLAFNYALGDGGALALVANSAVTLNHCTIAQNIAADRGGGIYMSSGQLSINNCTFTGNTAVDSGGAIYASPPFTISNSSLHNNVALAFGGGLFASGVTANNSTIANNVARRGGGLYAISALLTNCTISGNVGWLEGGGSSGVSGASSAWVNSTLAGNTAPTNANFRFLAAVVSNSLTNGDPLLAPLGNYGGPTPTMPPLAGSPALDAGADSVTNSLATDQRGFPRLAGAHVDIGAVEAQVANATNAPVLKLTFTSSPDTDFTVLATTNVALPAGQWSTLGPPTQNSPGQYQFTDIFAPDYPQRFYQVTSP